jgi:ribosomal protein S27E
MNSIDLLFDPPVSWRQALSITCAGCRLRIEISLEAGREIATSVVVCPVCQHILWRSREGTALAFKAQTK